MWLDDDEDDDPPMRGGVPDPSQRHWRHPSEVAAELAAMQTIDSPVEEPISRVPIIRPFGALVASIGVCSFALVAVVLSGYGDQPLNVETYEAASKAGSAAKNRATDGDDGIPSLSNTDLGKAQNLPQPVDSPAAEFATANGNADNTPLFDGPSTTRLTGSERSPDAPVQETSEIEDEPSTTPSEPVTGPIPAPEESQTDDRPENQEQPADRSQPERSTLSTDTSDQSSSIESNSVQDAASESTTAQAPQSDGPAASASLVETSGTLPELFGGPSANSAPLGSYVVGEGYILTPAAVLGQAQSAAIRSNNSWIVLQVVATVAGVAVLVPTTGYSLDNLGPQTDPSAKLTVGQKIMTGGDDTATSQHVGTVTSVGEVIETDIESDASLAGAPLFDESGVALGIVTANVAAPNRPSSETLVAVEISHDATSQTPPFEIVGIDGLTIELTKSSGLMVTEVPATSAASKLAFSNLFEVGDKVVECNDLPMRSIANVGALVATSEALVECTVVRGDVPVTLNSGNSDQLVGALSSE